MYRAYGSYRFLNIVENGPSDALSPQTRVSSVLEQVLCNWSLSSSSIDGSRLMAHGWGPS